MIPVTLSDRATAILATLGDREKSQSETRVDGPTVATFLQLSRDQHTIYRRNLKHSVAGAIVQGNPAAAAQALREAARMRAEAELADPEHDDPAWAVDLSQKFPHPALLEWYQEQITS